MSILIKLKEMRENFSKTDEKIADYINENLSKIRLINTYELAENSGVSQASIVRFAKKMGFSGFPEFKISLVEDIKGETAGEKLELVDKEIKIDDGTEDIAEKLLRRNISSLESTLKTMDFNNIEKAVESLKDARKILVIGAGSSAVIGKYFQSKLLEIGLDAVFEFDQHIQMLHVSRMDNRDVAFIISQSGKTLDTYTITKKLKGRGVEIISLTNMANNPIRENSDISLWTVSDSSAMTSTFTHRIAQLSLLDILYVKLILKNRKLAEKFLDNAFQMTEDMKLI
ncbi:MAG: MurR/RpiR family transcriptional regulator [Fusobacteriaceae bacterium]